MEVNLHRLRRSGFLLPDDIIFDVLTRLPAKVLCRFKCVCKGWRALLSDQAFIAAHKSVAAPLIAGVFRLPRGNNFELRVMDMDGIILRVFKNMPTPRFLAPTRLDLICVYNVPGDFATIVDPAAGRVLLIGGHNPGVDTSTLPHSYYSLGRAAPSGVYKVLRVDVAFDGRVQLCEIATIDDDCGSEPAWRERHVPSAITHWYGEEEATVNGILYFMSCVDDDTPQGCYSMLDEERRLDEDG
ncbi:hypothetical protein HU200_008468 [Digitaria exilis]|uniref:F-box domain-containing protein n=1 Tax=Digitaria exilis TaxID=1010633 RepID=A0A835FNF0_9POAL|nr:hypothetical protein HU200_059081 [Digitaria exilis]KAF8765528.1 hypothetical protein HU200_008468 [Digitaria exilis]